MWSEAMHPMGWGGHGLGLVLMVLFWAAVIAGAVYLVRALASRSGGAETALQVLERRYAEGAIDQQEFERKRADLSR